MVAKSIANIWLFIHKPTDYTQTISADILYESDMKTMTIHKDLETKIAYLYYNSPNVCLSVFAKCRSQLLLDRLGRCL